MKVKYCIKETIVLILIVWSLVYAWRISYDKLSNRIDDTNLRIDTHLNYK